MLELLSLIVSGLPLTLLMTAVAFVIGAVAAIPLMFGLRSRWLVLRALARVIVDLIRGIPIIVWLFLIYFGVKLGTIRFNPLAAAITGLSLITAAYLAEIYRGGIQSLPKGQFEAADALGLAHRVSLPAIIAPQVVRTISPSVTTYAIGLLKDSSIASTIGVVDMVFISTSYVRQNPGTAGLTPFVIVALIYIVVSIPLAILARRLDRRLRTV